MKRNRRLFEVKALLLSTTAATVLSIPAAAQERMPSTSQDRPAETQSQSPGSSQSSAQQDPSQRGQDGPKKGDTTGQGSPRQSAETPADAGKPNAAQNRDERSPSQPKSPQKQRSQSNDNEGRRSNQRMQSRDNDRARDNQRTPSRDDDRTQQRDRSATPDRQRQQDNLQSQQNRASTGRDGLRARDNNRQAAQPNEQQRTRISTSIRQANVQPVRNVNFSVSVGTVIPASVRVHPVTPAIVEVYPQFRGYSFVLVEDEIVIVEPRTKKIVTVIEHGKGGGRTAAVSRSKLMLTDKQRDVIRRSATDRRTTGSGGGVATMEREIVVGDELPDTVEVESFPDTIYTEVPEIRSYRYIVRDRDVYLVDPTERRVIEVIR
jgi:hypothetical protein